MGKWAQRRHKGGYTIASGPPAPVLVQDGAALAWTQGDPQPADWSMESSADGYPPWTQEAIVGMGDNPWGLANAGTFYSIVPLDVDDNPIGPRSNVVEFI